MGAWRSLVALIVTILGISMLSSTVNGHEMHQLKHHIAQRHPDFRYVEMNYPASPMMAQIASALFYIRIGVVAIALGGDWLFEYMNVEQPQWVRSLTQNKLQAVVTVFFLGNMVVSNLTKTGAFEIFINKGGGGELVFSKLDTGRVPSLDEIWQGIDLALALSSGH